MTKNHRVKCRYCGRGFMVPKGEFPKALFKHIGKKHKEAAARRSAAKRAAKASSFPRAPKRSRRAIISGSSGPSATDLESAIQTVRSHGGAVSFGSG